jgi:uncharacterized membrane protein YbjE (DUF340 family)
MRLWIKIGASILAFVPMLVLLLILAFWKSGLLPGSIFKPIYIACAIFNFPAFGLTYSVKLAFNLSQSASMVWMIIVMVLWSSFIAWVFLKIAEEFLGENEPEFETNPERAKFDWIGFQVRFVLGFIIGFLIGWRFVRYSTSKTTVLIAMIVTGLFVGLAYGLYRPNFWSR